MSTTVTYKGNTLTTINNATKKLNTKGKYMEDDVTITDTSSASAVSIVDELDSHGGTIRHITSNIVVSGTKTITTNGTHDVTNYTTAEVNVGGGSITDGTEVLSRNANDYPTSAKHYGTMVHIKQYWNRIATDGPWVNLTSITFTDTVTEIAAYGFAYCGALANIDVSHIVTLGNYAFQNCTSLTSMSFPVLTSLGQFAFIACTGLISLTLPLCTSYPNGCIRGCTGLQTVQMGSVGHAVTGIMNAAFQGSTQSGLTITVYTTGDKVDTLLTNIRNGATAATVIFKASEATTYNSNSYAADATMLTSTV